MRKSLIAGVTAGALVLAGLNAPSATSQTKPEGTGITAEDVEVFRNTADALEKLSAEGTSSSSEEGSSSKTDSKKKGPRKPGDPSPGLEGLNPDPANDPLYIDPEKNPLKEVSSSDMFLEWTDGMEEGEGKEFVQAWARNSSVPDTANPVELWKQEAQGSAMMSSGFFTGDFAQSSAGSSQATSVLIPVFLGMLVIGSLIELVMRGIRMAQQ
ncbi:hypothetical protein ACUY3P_09105 [Corynebacterium lehmanniae]